MIDQLLSNFELFGPMPLGRGLLPPGWGSWLQAHQSLMVGVGVVSTLLCLSGLLLTPVIVSRMPEDFLQRLGREDDSRVRLQGPGRWATWALRNFLGGVLLLLGLLLLVLPGPGWLFILLGLGMLDFPAKRRLVVAVLSRPAILDSLNWLRRRHRRPELLPPV